VPITVSQDSLKIGKSVLPGLTVNIPEANYEKTLKAWIKILETGTKSKVVTENNEMSIFGAKTKDVVPTTLNVYSKLIARDSSLQLSASFELGKDKYIDKTAGETDYDKAKNFLKQFAKDRYVEVAQDRVDSEGKKLKDLQKELTSLEKEKTRLQKSIQSNNSTIIEEKNNIDVQNNELKNVSASIIDNNSQLSGMDEGPAKEERQKYIKDLEKRQKKALGGIESSENKINKSNSEIDQANRDISTNEMMQEKVREQIAQQEAVLQKFTNKLTTIKGY
jgi:predicted  nucleic acid-binding Zn-ribbon protein